MRLQAHVIRRSDLPQEVERCGIATEQDMLAVVDHFACDRVGKRGRPSAESSASFENQYTEATRGQTRARAQPGASSAHDNDIWNHRRASDSFIPRRGKLPPRDAIEDSTAPCTRRYPLFQRNDGLRRSWHPNDIRENVVATELDPIQGFVIDGPHDFGGYEPLPIFDRKRCRGSPIELTRSSAFVPNQLPHRLGHDAGAERLFSTAERSQILQRQIQPTAQPIAADIAKNVGELKSQSKIHGILARLDAAAAEYCDADEPHSGRHSAAVFVQLIECRISPGIKIHGDAVDHVVEGLTRQAKRPDERLQPTTVPGLRRLGIEAPSQLRTPEADGFTWRGRLTALGRLVDGVVDRAAKVPYRHNGPALPPGQNEEGIVETRLTGH